MLTFLFLVAETVGVLLKKHYHHTYILSNKRSCSTETQRERKKERIFVKKMAISVSNNSYTEESQTSLLEGTVAGAVDYKGNPVLRANSGGWRSASFMIGTVKKTRNTRVLAARLRFMFHIYILSYNSNYKQLTAKKVNEQKG